MFAIIKTGGKQFRVEPDTIVTIEKLNGSVGDEVVFDQVYLIDAGDQTIIGTPVLEDAQVKGQIIRQHKGPKIVIFKKKRRKKFRRKTGHRQLLTSVMIRQIVHPDLTV